MSAAGYDDEADLRCEAHEAFAAKRVDALADQVPEIMLKWNAVRLKLDQAGKDCAALRMSLKGAEAKRERLQRDLEQLTGELRAFVGESMGEGTQNALDRSYG